MTTLKLLAMSRPNSRTPGAAWTGMLASMAVVAAGYCEGAQAQGLVQGTLGVGLSPAPGQPPAVLLRGGVALQLEQVELEGQRWQHLLGSDGRHGWTNDQRKAVAPVTAAAVTAGFELMPLPPGAPEFWSSVGQPVPELAEGRLLGGSRNSLVSSTEDQMIPAWLNPTLAPWPRWSMGGVQGYAPLSSVALSWRAPRVEGALGASGASGASGALGAAADNASASEVLGALNLDGLSQAPFLARMASKLQRLAPRNGAKALDLSGAPAQKARWLTLEGLWQGPQCAYRSTSPPRAGGLAALLCYSQGGARTFVLQASSGKTLSLHAAEDSLSISRVDERDLDGDGWPEWLIEVVGRYGDGYYSELWIVNGRSSQGQPRVDRQALSSSSGETPSAAQDAAWGIDKNRVLWIWRSTARAGQFRPVRYGKRGLSALDWSTPALVLLGDDESLAAAQQRNLRSLTPTSAAMMLPLRTPSGLRWLNAIPALSASEAKRWASDHSLPATAVKRLPWNN